MGFPIVINTLIAILVVSKLMKPKKEIQYILFVSILRAILNLLSIGIIYLGDIDFFS